MAQAITLKDIQNEIVDDLSYELSAEDNDYDENILEIKAKNVLREAIARRNYPATTSDDVIMRELYREIARWEKITLFDYNQIGAEGQSLHSEDDVQRSWVSRDDLWIGWVAFVSAL